MNIKTPGIGKQLRFGYAVFLLLFILLGVVTFMQTDQLHEQTEIMYNHPLQVRRALENINIETLNMGLYMRDLIIVRSEQERLADIQLMELSKTNMELQFTILRDRYMGSQEDVDKTYQAYILWKTAIEEHIVLALSGEAGEAVNMLYSEGTVDLYKELFLESIKYIGEFAENKADTLYSDSAELNDWSNRFLLILLVGVIIFAYILSNFIYKNIKNPLDELNRVALSVQKGDLTDRSSIKHGNEYGVLSSSFNSMLQTIQMNMSLNEKSARLAGVMLSEGDAKTFFRSTLNELAAQTNAQVAAVYLLSEDKKTFEHFESIGMDDNRRQSFNASRPEGEFGLAITSRKRQYIADIPENTRFVFSTTSGSFIPREIITVPILAHEQIIAVISLATITNFSGQALELIDDILNTMSARIDGVLTYRIISNLNEEMEEKNRELEAQHTELAAQNAELTYFNSELEMQKKQLGEANRLKNSFLSNMSHELHTPLNSVIALSGVLNRRLAERIPEEELGYLEIIERSGKNLLNLINDILDISRLEAGRVDIEITRFNINSLIADIVSMIQPLADQKNIETIHEGKDMDFFIESDLDKCHHILQNIIGNAVKITARQRDDHIEIKVVDTGIGIAEEHQLHIFDEFRQADSSTSRRFGGTGLGLAIANKYAKLLSGSINAISNLDEGSEFTISLPMQYSDEYRTAEVGSTAEIITEPQYSPDQTSVKPTSPSSQKTILLVEDSEPAVVQIKDLMEESGHRVIVARDGAEALGIIEQIMPEAIILDLMMPGIDGFEVLKTLHEVERTAHVPVLILTAKHITKEEYKLLKQNNIHQLIQKGDINRLALQKAVAAMLFPNQVSDERPGREKQIIKGKPLVLAVEDNPDNMISVKAMLVGRYDIIEAADGREAVEMAKQNMPHLILMDLDLPEMDGIEAFETIRNSLALQHIPIIALTAYAMPEDREKVLAHGFDAFIPKPITEKQLFKVIDEVLYGK